MIARFHHALSLALYMTERAFYKGHPMWPGIPPNSAKPALRLYGKGDRDIALRVAQDADSEVRGLPEVAQN